MVSPLRGDAYVSVKAGTSRAAADGDALGDGVGPPTAGWPDLPNTRKAPPTSKHADHGGRGDAGREGHGREPPRHAHGAPLSSQMDLVDDGIQHPIGELVWAVGQPGHGDPVEVAIGSHASRSVTVGVRASASSAARSVYVA